MSEDHDADIHDLFADYAAGFDDFDETAIADRFAYPCTIWQLGTGNVFLDEEELLENIDALLAVFDAEEIVHSSFEILALSVTGPTAIASLSWRQERQDGEVALAFICHYALIRQPAGWRIALVVNE